MRTTLPVNGRVADWLRKEGLVPAQAGVGSDTLEAAYQAVKSGRLLAREYIKLINSDGYSSDGFIHLEEAGLLPDVDTKESNMTLATKAAGGPTVNDLLDNARAGGTGGAGDHIRTKRASELYKKDTTPVVHKATGQQLSLFGASVETPSECTYAMLGSWWKHHLASHGAALKGMGAKIPVLSDHEKDLLVELYETKQFCGEMAGGKYVDRAKVVDVGLDVKALLSDSLSGGNSLIPYDFDVALVRTPYLHSQLLPYVDMRNANSNEVRTSAMGQVVVSWGTPEGTAISLFNTDGLFAPIVIPIHECTAAVELGLDLEADTPVAELGRIVTEEFGLAMLKDFDRVIAVGNGTNEPEGIFTASGTVGANSDNNVAGPPTMNDYMKLLFAVDKAFRDTHFGVYVGNDESYRRARAIKIDTASPSTDQRPVFGMDIESYQHFEHPFVVCPSIPNNKLAFACLKRYRMYRRTGVEVTTITQDWALARAMKKGIILRSRMGGELVSPTAVAVMEDAQN